jgi:hypothetical protein
MADETLMELIDAYAEARHVGGCHTYNAKTAEARAKVVASLAASAGSEPVAWGIFDSEGFYEVALDEGSGQRFVDHYNKRRDGPLKPFSLRALYTHPSPPEGAGWISVDERLPEPGQNVAFVVRASSYGSFRLLNGRVLGGRFLPGEGFSLPGLCVDASHWMPLPAPPASEAKGA